jgi:hypothetical protein
MNDPGPGGQTSIGRTNGTVLKDEGVLNIKIIMLQSIGGILVVYF